MPENFFIDSKRNIEAYAKWLDETLSDDSEKTDPIRDIIYVSKGHYIKSKLIVNFLNEEDIDKYSSKIPTAIHNLGENFLSVIQGAREKDKDKVEVDIDTVINFLGQVAQEVQLRQEGSPKKPLVDILNYFFYSEYRTDTERSVSVYLTGKLPLLVYAGVVNEDIDSVTNKLKTAETKISEWNTKLDSLENTATKVETLESKLKELKVSFNFLGLSAAFNQFYKTKKGSLSITLVSLLMIGTCIIAIPSYTFYSINNIDISAVSNTSETKQRKEGKEKTNEAKQNPIIVKKGDIYSSAITVIPIVAIEIILLYFFRILLQHYNSTKSQIMQLQLRNAICQFIETYVKFKDENKEHKESFEKFESLIFSGLAPNDEAIPSTFDGIEQLGKLVKTLKG